MFMRLMTKKKMTIYVGTNVFRDVLTQPLSLVFYVGTRHQPWGLV